MKKTIIPIILGIVFISLASALTDNLTAGEPYSFDLGKIYSYYEIIGNSSEVDLNISQNGTIVTIVPSKYSNSDNFTITFYGEKDEVITSGSSSSSSGSGGSYSSRQKIYLDNYTGDYPRYFEEVDEKEDLECVDCGEEGDKMSVAPLVWILFIVSGICIVIWLIVDIKRYKNEKRGKKKI